MRMRRHVDEDIVYTARGSPLSVQHRPAPRVMRRSGVIECTRMCRSASASWRFLSIFLSLGIFVACALLGPFLLPFWGPLRDPWGVLWEVLGRSCGGPGKALGAFWEVLQLGNESLALSATSTRV